MSKRDRELALGEAVRILSHTAHHVGPDAEPEVFSRVDAALVVAATAGLISSLLQAPYEPPVAIMEEASPPKKASSSSVSATRLTRVVEHFRARPNNRPTTLVGLRRVLKSLFGGKLSDDQTEELIGELTAKGIVIEDNRKLKYEIRS